MDWQQQSKKLPGAGAFSELSLHISDLVVIYTVSIRDVHRSSSQAMNTFKSLRKNMTSVIITTFFPPHHHSSIGWETFIWGSWTLSGRKSCQSRLLTLSYHHHEGILSLFIQRQESNECESWTYFHVCSSTYNVSDWNCVILICDLILDLIRYHVTWIPVITLCQYANAEITQQQLEGSWTSQWSDATSNSHDCFHSVKSPVSKLVLQIFRLFIQMTWWTFSNAHASWFRGCSESVIISSVNCNQS